MEKFKVIIVEDVKLELKGTEEIFRHEIPNAEVIGTAMTEAEFWPLLEQHTPDLILLDAASSQIDGFELSRYVRQSERFATVPVLFLTGDNNLEAHMEGARSLADDYLVKPVIPELYRYVFRFTELNVLTVSTCNS